MKLTRKSAGRYETTDGRFVIKDGYDPSGPVHVREGRNSSIRWSLLDIRQDRVSFHFTLARCREFVEAKLAFEASERP